MNFETLNKNIRRVSRVLSRNSSFSEFDEIKQKVATLSYEIGRAEVNINLFEQEKTEYKRKQEFALDELSLAQNKQTSLLEKHKHLVDAAPQHVPYDSRLDDFLKIPTTIKKKTKVKKISRDEFLKSAGDIIPYDQLIQIVGLDSKNKYSIRILRAEVRGYIEQYVRKQDQDRENYQGELTKQEKEIETNEVTISLHQKTLSGIEATLKRLENDIETTEKRLVLLRNEIQQKQIKIAEYIEVISKINQEETNFNKLDKSNPEANSEQLKQLTTNLEQLEQELITKASDLADLVESVEGEYEPSSMSSPGIKRLAQLKSQVNQEFTLTETKKIEKKKAGAWKDKINNTLELNDFKSITRTDSAAPGFKNFWTNKLNEYWTRRCQKYAFKDYFTKSFISSDHACRLRFITELKGLISQYRPGDISLRSKLVSHFNDFNLGYLSDKTAPYNSLSGIIKEMLKCMDILEQKPNSSIKRPSEFNLSEGNLSPNS